MPKKSIGPGPKYQLPPLTGYPGHDTSRFRNPQYSMGIRLPGLKQSYSPGPQYDVRDMTPFGKNTPPCFSMKSRPEPLKPFAIPGPGTYRNELVPRMKEPRPPTYSLSFRHPPLRKFQTPGPDVYTVPTTIGPKVPDKGANAAYSMSYRQPLINKDRSPGPARYDNISVSVFKSRPPDFTISPRVYMPDSKKVSPGPIYKIVLPGKPGYSFGLRTDQDPYITPSDNMPCKRIVNRGDSFRRRRSRSNSLCPPPMGGATPSPVMDEPQQNVSEISNYTVALLGAQGVGKTALISQFMTSECINAYDRQKDILGAQTVSIMLNREESELTFQNTTSSKDVDMTHPPDAFVVLYSVVDKASFLKAEIELNRLQDGDLLRSRPAILVGNKIDLARSRAVSTQDGKCLACTYRAKFIEISVGINHNVDELLVGILTQIRLKVLNFEEGSHGQQWYKSRGMVKASMKARQMFTWLFGKEDSKFKNCENLHIL